MAAPHGVDRGGRFCPTIPALGGERRLHSIAWIVEDGSHAPPLSWGGGWACRYVMKAVLFAHQDFNVPWLY